MSNMNMELNHQTLLVLRAEKCWSQEELAAATGLSIRTIQRVEKQGNASLETTKALASVYNVTPTYLQKPKNIERLTFHYLYKYSWLVAFAASSVLFGLWIVDILIPTLKGGNFDELYEMHGNFRYLDYGGVCFFLGFVLLAINIYVEHARRHRAIQQ
ncbi:helix-turn-helix domain-containing protein [Thalassotalea euphylliae]|uniref:helix-turn-helix domain-containing protein n=1 Tax=Thalassotalea euphylliae TaxID=1655234 RepID=UPI003629A81E